MTIFGEQPFGTRRYMDVQGVRMAYVDEGEGPAVIFQHGSPTSSYLWRNVMPHSAGLGRLIACDLAGFGESDKVDPSSGRYRYGYEQQRSRLFELWDRLDVGDDVVLVVHDIGSIYGFDWAATHSDRVAGVAYMESLVMPLVLSDFPERFRTALAGRAGSEERPEGPAPSLAFVEEFLLGTREFSETERAWYLRPFLVPGEGRRAFVGTQFSIDGAPGDTTAVMERYARWLETTAVPKLLISAEPGFILKDRLLAFARTFRNQREIAVEGTHFVQETSPHQIGSAIAQFVRSIRGPAAAANT